MDIELRQDSRDMGQASMVPAYGLAGLRAGWSVLRTLKVASTRGMLRLRIPEIHYVEEFDAATGSRVEAHTPERVAAIEAALETVVRPLSLLVHVEHEDERVGGGPITILPPWSWPLFAEARVLAAAYVVPGEQVLERIVAAVRESVAVREAPGDAATTLRLVYEALASRLAIRLETPRTQTEPWSDCLHQTIRSPAELLDRSASFATCMDLTLLLAGALEALGMQPLLVFLGDEAAAPEHVLLGVWAHPARRFRPWIDDAASVREALETGDVLVVESTGLCQGDAAFGFDDSCNAAARRVRGSRTVEAVDVGATRPPTGSVAPLVLASDPVVALALTEARDVAERLGAPHHESVHVLYGLCQAAGPLTRWLLASRGSSVEGVVARIEATLPRRRGLSRSTATPLPTRNYTTCLSSARGNASSRGASAIEEGDLLWALLENPSASVRRVLEEEGCRLSWLQRELATRFERPGTSTSLSWTAPQTMGTERRSLDG